MRNLYLTERTRAARHIELNNSLPSSAASQDTRIEHQGALTAVLRALRVLPEIDRAALLMRTQDGMSYEEIAQALQLTQSSAKVKVHRARIKLAAMVERTVSS